MNYTQSWTSRIHLQNNMSIEERQKDNYNRKVCSILNKVTPQNFRKMLGQMVNLNVNNEEKIQTVVKVVFRKSVDGSLYSEIYANFCYALLQEIKNVSTSNAQLFLRLLYEEAQSIARLILEDNNPEKKSFAERREIFCCIIFVGQLFNRKVISYQYIHTSYIKKLLSRSPPTASLKKYEYQVECLCKFMHTIGHKLDTQHNKELVSGYFENLKYIEGNENLCTRVKMLIMNLFELRADNWRDRRRKEKPVTIDQIRSQRGG